MSIDATLNTLGIELPAPPKPVASYVPAVLVGDLLYLSGMLPFRDGQGQAVGLDRGKAEMNISKKGVPEAR